MALKKSQSRHRFSNFPWHTPLRSHPSPLRAIWPTRTGHTHPIRFRVCQLPSSNSMPSHRTTPISMDSIPCPMATVRTSLASRLPWAHISMLTGPTTCTTTILCIATTTASSTSRMHTTLGQAVTRKVVLKLSMQMVRWPDRNVGTESLMQNANSSFQTSARSVYRKVITSCTSLRTRALAR